MQKVTGTFSAIGVGSSIKINKFNGNFNISLAGFGDATITLQRSYDRYDAVNDAAATWEDVTDGSFTANVSRTGYEPEDRVYYRFNCTAWTSGDIVYRIGLGTRLVL